MAISVIVPTTGRVDLLERALSSIRMEGSTIAEVIVTASGPRLQEPNVARRLKEMAVRYDSELIVSRNVLRAGAARNRGAAASTGDVIAFCDDDDVWSAGLADAFLADASGGAVVAPLHLVDASTGCRGVKPLREEILETDLSIWNPGSTGSNLALPRVQFEELGGYNENLDVLNDLELLVRILKNYGPLDVVADWKGHVSKDLGAPYRLSRNSTRRRSNSALLFSKMDHVRLYHPQLARQAETKALVSSIRSLSPGIFAHKSRLRSLMPYMAAWKAARGALRSCQCPTLNHLRPGVMPFGSEAGR